MPSTLAVIDDGLFVRAHDGEVHPVAATFHRFVEAVARTQCFDSVRYVVPVRRLRIWEDEPVLPAVDRSAVEIVATAPFSGIADYVVRSGYLSARNWSPIHAAVAGADLLWLRLPASNALLALAAARLTGTPYFSWLAGSVEDVARSQQRRAPLQQLAVALGRAYDAVTELATLSAPAVRLDAEMFTSVTEEHEVAAARVRGAPNEGPPWRLVWAGRMAGEKGLDVLLDALDMLVRDGLDVTLTLVGDGPQRERVANLAQRLPGGRVSFAGYVGQRAAFNELVASAHLLIQPSLTEGVSKVLIEAMAAGTPIVATAAGATPDVLGGGERGRLVPVGDAIGLAGAIRDLLDDRAERQRLRGNGLDWAAEHTLGHQAGRLVAWLEQQFPSLDWGSRDG